MKRLLLVSMFEKISHRLQEIELEFHNKTVTYIPTASLVEDTRDWISLEKMHLQRMGLAVDELDISKSSYETIQQTLQKNDLIYIAGGNTFFLLQELKRTGADRLIAEEVNRGKLYIGESAGAIVTAPDIGYSAAMDDREKAPKLKEDSGLHLIDFFVLPHAGNPAFQEAVEEILRNYASSLDLKVISDRQALFVADGRIEILE